jgi:hypothetical protein
MKLRFQFISFEVDTLVRRRRQSQTTFGGTNLKPRNLCTTTQQRMRACINGVTGGNFSEEKTLQAMRDDTVKRLRLAALFELDV